MSYNDLDDFDLDSPLTEKSTIPPNSHLIAATPSSLLQLQNHPESSSLYATEPHLRTASYLALPSSPKLNAHSTSSDFPFPSLSNSRPPARSPALHPSAPSFLAARSRICVSIDHLSEALPDQSPTTLATPPSPLGLPGTFNLWTRRRSSLSSLSPSKRKGRAKDSLEGELLLPPPFLDKDDSSPNRQSFEGILGWKSAKQAERVRQENEKLYALGRHPPLPFPQSLFKSFGKLVAILGPPGGYDGSGRFGYESGAKKNSVERYEKQQRRRVQRAESGLKAYDVGSRVGGEVAGRLRRRHSERKGQETQNKRSVSTATPRSSHYRTTSPSPLPDNTARKVVDLATGLDSTSSASRFVDFAIYVLVGNYEERDACDNSVDSLGGFIGILIHLIGFVFFVVSHTASLAVSSIVAARTLAIFLYWTVLNLSGRTELSRAVIAYWRTCRKEWDRVCIEEEGGNGLSILSAMRGLAELAALHSMTRDRWLAEELDLLNGDSLSTPIAISRLPTKLGGQRVRPSFTMRGSSFRWNHAEEDKNRDGLVITSRGGSLLEGTLITSSEDAVERKRRRRSTLSPILVPAMVDELTEEPVSIYSPSAETFQPSQSGSRAGEVDTTELVSLLKRCGRLSTAAYGLQTYIVSPPTPLLTPSGATLPHRLFAHLGGIKDHRDVLHVALQKNRSESSNAETVYAPTFYLLRDDSRRLVIVVFRGTQSLADIKTDLEGDFVPLSLALNSSESVHSDASTSYRIHAGILAAAHHLLDRNASPLFSKLVTSLDETGYDLLLTGHSLGSALASTIALLVSDYDSSTQRWTTSSSSGLPPQRSIRAITFAHPTTLNAPLAARCASGIPPLVMSVSLASDVITRAGLPQLRELRRTLGRLDQRRRRDGDILSEWWRWRKLLAEAEEDRKKQQTDEGRRETVKALEESAWTRRLAAEGDLSGLSSDDIDTAVPAGKAFHLDRLPPSLAAERRRGATSLDKGSNAKEGEEDEELMLGLYEVRAPQRFYHSPLLLSDLVKSHLPKEYLDAVESL